MFEMRTGPVCTTSRCRMGLTRPRPAGTHRGTQQITENTSLGRHAVCHHCTAADSGTTRVHLLYTQRIRSVAGWHAWRTAGSTVECALSGGGPLAEGALERWVSLPRRNQVRVALETDYRSCYPCPRRMCLVYTQKHAWRKCARNVRCCICGPALIMTIFHWTAPVAVAAV